MKASEWIDRLKEAKGWESDYRVAQEIGVGRSAVSRYRREGSTFDDDIALRVAQALGEPVEVIFLDQAAERSQSEAVRTALAEAVERMRGKVEAVPLPGVHAAGGKGRIDITSVTLIGGDPESLHRNTHRIAHHPNAFDASLSSEIVMRMLARRSAQSSYRPQPATA